MLTQVCVCPVLDWSAVQGVFIPCPQCPVQKKEIPEMSDRTFSCKLYWRTTDQCMIDLAFLAFCANFINCLRPSNSRILAIMAEFRHSTPGATGTTSL